MKSPLLLMVAMIGTISRDHPCYDKTESLRDLKTIRARFKHEGMSFLSKTLPNLETAILHGLETGTFTCPSSFRRMKDGSIPLFLRGLIGMMFDPKTGSILDFEPLLLKNIRQLLLLFKKVQLTPKNFQVLDKRAKVGFMNIEDLWFSSLRTDPRLLDIYDRVSQIGSSRLTYNPDEFIGKHGPGAVAESLSPNEKWTHVQQTSLVASGEPLNYLKELTRVISDGSEVLIDSRSARSRLISVPKNSTSVRLITVEPCLKQFIQGGLNVILRKFIREHSIYNRCLNLTDQSKSQDYALKGSISRDYATIDLSSASDTIDSELVHRTFAKNHDFLRDLILVSRTPYLDVSGKSVLMKKFAGMGNATTFPVMSIIFSNIIFGAMFDTDGLTPSERRMKHYASLFQVYGDDIAVPRKYCSKVMEWLVAFGFKPNVNKSFSEGYFRESCGLDSYKGVNVTPIYVRVWPEDLKKTDASSLASLVATSNQFWLDCNYGVSNVIKCYVEEVFGRLPHTTSDSGCIGWVARRVRVPIERWNADLQRPEYRALCVRVRKRKDILSGLPALLKFFHVGYNPKEEYLEDVRPRDHLEKSSKRYSTRVVQGWFPSPMGFGKISFSRR